jgi:hypothetical protein
MKTHHSVDDDLLRPDFGTSSPVTSRNDELLQPDFSSRGTSDDLMRPDFSTRATTDELLTPSFSDRGPSGDLTSGRGKGGKQMDGLPAEYFVLEPGDHELLAKLVEKYPGLQQRILDQAAKDLGNETVSKALEILHGGRSALEQNAKRVPLKSEDQVLTLVLALEPGDHELLASLIRNHPDMQDKIVEEARKWVDDATVKKALELLGGEEGTATSAGATTADTEPAGRAPASHDRKNEPAWVTRARAYNKRHDSEVTLFNYATKWSMAPDGKNPEPSLVAEWQAAHGLAPDGRVGEKTSQKAIDLMFVERERVQAIVADAE